MEVADDVETLLGAADGNVQEVGLFRGPFLGSWDSPRFYKGKLLVVGIYFAGAALGRDPVTRSIHKHIATRQE